MSRRLADLLTLLRGAAAALMVWVGLALGAEGLGLASWLLMFSWTTDLLDGPLARSDRSGEPGWLGDYDITLDIVASLGLLGYMVLAEFLPLSWAAAYLILWALIFLRWGFARSPGMLLQAPIYGWFLLVNLRLEWAMGLRLVAWILIALVLTWPRFPQQVLPDFLEGMSHFARRI